MLPGTNSTLRNDAVSRKDQNHIKNTYLCDDINVSEISNYVLKRPMIIIYSKNTSIMQETFLNDFSIVLKSDKL